MLWLNLPQVFLGGGTGQKRRGLRGRSQHLPGGVGWCAGALCDITQGRFSSCFLKSMSSGGSEGWGAKLEWHLIVKPSLLASPLQQQPQQQQWPWRAHLEALTTEALGLLEVLVPAAKLVALGSRHVCIVSAVDNRWNHTLKEKRREGGEGGKEGGETMEIHYNCLMLLLLLPGCLSC